MSSLSTSTAASNVIQPFCDTPLWNVSWTLNTSSPEFTKCFQDTILVYIPCGFLFLLFPFYLCMLVLCKEGYIEFNRLNISKIVLAVLMIVVCLVEFSWTAFMYFSSSITIAEIIKPVVRLSAACQVIVITEKCRAHGLTTSVLLFVHWCLQSLCAIFIARSTIQRIVEGSELEIGQITSFVYFGFVFLELILSLFSDGPCRDSVKHFSTEKPCPEKSAPVLSKLTFWWITRLVYNGYKQPIVESDLWSLNPSEQVKHLIPIFWRNWKTEIAKANRKNLKKGLGQEKRPSEIPLNTVEGESFVVVKDGKKKMYSPSLIMSLWKCYGLTFVVSASYKLIYDLLLFVNPALLKLIIGFTKNKNDYLWKGVVYASMMLVTAFCQSLILHQYFHLATLIGIRARSCLIAAIYRKAMKLSSLSRQSSTLGEMVNLMSVDAQRFQELSTYINMLWSAPLQMIVCLYFLWRTLGPAVLAGVAVMVALIPINAFLAKIQRSLQAKQMEYKDMRLKLMSEVLNGIKVLKLYAWELSFQEKILKFRNQELSVMKKAAYLNAATSFTWNCAPFLVSLTTFAVYVNLSPDNTLDAEKAFVSLSYFNILQFPMTMLPMLIGNLVQSSVSITRLKQFLSLEELDKDAVTHNDDQDCSIKIDNGTFSWSDNSVVLRDISVNVPMRELVAVVGPVGVGKSSLLSAILGEMNVVAGTVSTKGQIAYVAQQAWIQNATLRDNILFGKPFDECFYLNIIKACSLESDLQMLPAGDQTEIGEKGINVSGGQKQRIALARAVYQDCDIYLLDDPLSAVDAHVGKHIFEHIIGPKGLLKGKTRVLVTHGISILPFVDKVVVLSNGMISEIGSYEVLRHSGNAFAEFIAVHTVGSKADEISLDGQSVSDSRNSLNRTRRDTLKSQISGISQSSKGCGDLHHNFLDSKKETDHLITEEKAQVGRVKMSVFLAYLRAMGLVLTFIIALLFILTNVASIGANFWLSAWSNEVDRNNGTMSTGQRDYRLGIYGFLGFLQGVFVFVGSLLLAIGIVRASTSIHLRFLVHVLKLPLSFFDVTPVGRVLNRFSKDINVMDQNIPVNISALIRCLINVVGVLIVISLNTPIFIAITPILGIVYVIVQRFYVATSRQLQRLESASRSPMYSHFGESIQGASTIRAFHKENEFIDISDKYLDQSVACYFPSVCANRWLAVRLEFVGNAIVFFAAIFAVFGRDTLNAGMVGLSITYALNITQTLNWMVRMSGELETNTVAIERLLEYTETPTEAEWFKEGSDPSDDWPDKGAIEFRKYSTRYRPGLDLVLSNVSCVLQPGEKIGVVGRTGAGKSSLTLALFRIIEAATGSIVIDGINVSKIGLYSLRSKLTIIPQDPVLFSGTMRMNLDPLDKYTDEEIWTVLARAHLKTYIMLLPDKLEYICAEGGENLSVGQRQLVCLARALLRHSKILILDEATAAVDLETDDLIQSTIRSEFHDSTVVTIAHRINTIMDYTKILVMDKGKIAQLDAPDSLLKIKSGIFYGMALDAGLVH